MDEKEIATLRCINELEVALFEYIEKYGPTKKAKLAISRAAITREALGNDLTQ